MRIGREYKPCELKFKSLNIGDAFYHEGEYDEGDYLYMKIQRVEYDVTRCDVYRRNAVKLEDGSLAFVDDDDTVTIANVHIEKD